MPENINAMLNEHFVNIAHTKNIYLACLEDIYLLAPINYNFYKDLEYLDFDEKDLSFISLDETLNIIRNYYKINDIPINIDELIEEGILKFVSKKDIDQEEYHNKLGLSTIKNNKNYTEIVLNNTIMDSIVTIHELSHNSNLISQNESQSRNLTTEVIAYTEELIFIDYLISIGYEDAKTFQRHLIDLFSINALHSLIWLKLYLLYYRTGNITEENYNRIYADKNFNSFKRMFQKEFKDYKHLSLDASIRNVFYTTCSLHCYMEYKKKNLSIENIKRVNELINSDIEESLSLLRIIKNNEFNYGDIKKNLDELKDSLTKKELTFS